MRVLIVDDEPLSRRKLRRLLNGECDLEIIGECTDGAQAVTAIAEQKPDLVFLDVQMPEMDGLGVIYAVGPQRMPLVVLVTAYDHYALKAFEVSALDYLLKPVNRERFQAAVARARSQMELGRNGEVGQRLQALLEHLQAGQEYSRRLMLKSEGRVFFLTVDEIDWIEAAHNYLVLHVGTKSHLIRETMDSLEARLDPNHFVRIHRSTVVNLERIQEMHPWVRGEHAVLLRDGTRLTLSRSYYERLRQRLGEPS